MCETGTANLPNGKLPEFLYTLENPVKTQVFVRAGRNEVGGARFIATRRKLVEAN